MSDLAKYLLPLGLLLLMGCSLKGVDVAKSACVAEIKEKLEVDVSESPSTWKAYAGTGGKSTTITYLQTNSTPAVLCITSGGEVKSLTKSETTVVK